MNLESFDPKTIAQFILMILGIGLVAEDSNSVLIKLAGLALFLIALEWRYKRSE